MTTSEQAKFRSLLEKFSTAMLVTRTEEDLLRSRPMALAQVDDDCNLWFLTAIDSTKVDEIFSRPIVNVALAKDHDFVSITGRAELIRDPTKVAELWSEPMKVWFPEGKDDPDLCLIRVESQDGEYWDNTGLNRLAYVFRAVKAYATGERVETKPSEHGRVLLNH